jgi:hypothetical protein
MQETPGAVPPQSWGCGGGEFTVSLSWERGFPASAAPSVY